MRAASSESRALAEVVLDPKLSNAQGVALFRKPLPGTCSMQLGPQTVRRYQPESSRKKKVKYPGLNLSLGCPVCVSAAQAGENPSGKFRRKNDTSPGPAGSAAKHDPLVIVIMNLQMHVGGGITNDHPADERLGEQREDESGLRPGQRWGPVFGNPICNPDKSDERTLSVPDNGDVRKGSSVDKGDALMGSTVDKGAARPDKGEVRIGSGVDKGGALMGTIVDKGAARPGKGDVRVESGADKGDMQMGSSVDKGGVRDRQRRCTDAVARRQRLQASGVMPSWLVATYGVCDWR
ncbi:hypothetical protein B0H16DRAFT_1451497 [Mycena metata]|uniref:Uncharacterized protein n=1 Tax=Mycena metata TaxID=1033252 RepID=A0AAD7JV60_9AGAR|nr:hypothetical protein B0H16DRAFT_1451497 [Mycena metata]